MRKVFIDCGANNGSSVRKFKKEIQDANAYEIYSFEADPIFNKNFPIDGVKYHNRAVWINDEEITFFRIDVNKKGKRGPTEAGTLIEAKNDWNINKAGHKSFVEVNVKAIDFDAWIRNNFSVNDHIVLKLDIEGAEYEVLDHMFENGSIKYINVLLYEFHNRKCGKTVEDDKALLEKLNKYNIKCGEWDAGGYS